MANPVAEAFVTIRPDFSVFNAQLQQGVAGGIARVRVPAAAGQRLGGQIFGAGFRQQAQTSIAGGVQNVAVTSNVQRNFAQKLFGPGFRNEAGRAIQGTIVGLGAGQLAAQFAFFGAGGAALAVLTGAAVSAEQQAKEFNRTLSVLQATTGATNKEMAALAKRAIELGADIRLPAVTAQTAATAMTELSKAGLSIRDTFAGVEGVLQLSTAAQISAGQAAEIVASALNAFSLAGDQAVHVADLLAASSIAAQGNIQDMALALQQSAAVAHQVGLNVDELVGFITLLAQRGILGSDAGTSIRTSLLRLAPTTKEASKLMEELGIKIDQTRSIGQQLPDLLDQYRIAFGGLTKVQQQQVLAQIAGTDAIRALSIAIDAGGEGFRTATLEVDRSNAALKLSEAQTKGLAGSLQGLSSNTQTFALRMGEDFAPAVQAGVGALNGLVTGLNKGQDAMDALDKQASHLLKPIGDLLTKFDHLAAQGSKDLFVLPGDSEISKLLGGGGDFGKDMLANLRESGQVLDTALTAAIETRKQLDAAGLPTTKIDAQIKRLQNQLRGIREEAGTDVGLDLATPVDKAVAELKKLKEALTLQGAPAGQIAAVQKQIDDLTNNVTVAAARAAKKAEERAKATQQLARALGLTPSEIAKLTKTIEDEGPKAGIRLGRSYMKGVAQGITEQEQRAIDAAQKALADVQARGEQQILDSIRSTRGNIESLADTIVQETQRIIDLGPIQQRIDALQKELDALQDKTSKRKLRFDISQAKKDLHDAQQAVASTVKLTPEEKKAQQEFLRPFQEKLADAKTSLKEFNLQSAIDQQTKLKDAAKKAAEEGVQKLVAQFEDGKITASQFADKLRAEVRPELDAIRRKNLGLVITRDFLRDLQTIVDQAKALQSFIGTPGTTPGSQVIKPSATVTEVAQNTKDAADRLQQIREDAKKQTKDQIDEAKIQTGLLRRLVKLLDGNPKGAR